MEDLLFFSIFDDQPIVSYVLATILRKKAINYEVILSDCHKRKLDLNKFMFLNKFVTTEAIFKIPNLPFLIKYISAITMTTTKTICGHTKPIFN